MSDLESVDMKKRIDVTSIGYNTGQDFLYQHHYNDYSQNY